VTDGGKLIRSPVDDVRIAGRTTRGVTLFRIDESERIVSVAHLPEEEASDEDGGEDGDGAASAGPDEA
jgi:DNA gyrase subunit A